jgi:ApbE superfamily uncharacterized protein (UPF0280 family)
MSRQSGGATCARLGMDRWHFQHGPIDLVIDVDADAQTRESSIQACWEEFQHVLPGLVRELPELRRAASDPPHVFGSVAERMLLACEPFAGERFITPMAAVAGAVADELIGIFNQTGVERACINNGGDIALMLSPGASYRVGIRSPLDARRASSGGPPVDGRFTIDCETPVRGIATSGWRGRSFSLGIADCVTVLASNAAAADAAATLIANAVDCDHAEIVRAPALRLKDDTDLGDRLVTVAVPRLPAAAVAAALAGGRAEAERWRDRSLIYAAAILLQGHVEAVLPAVRIAAANGERRVPFEPAIV